MNNTQDINKNSTFLHSKKSMVSYGFGAILVQILPAVFDVYILIFYETEVGLGIWYIAFGYAIYAIWNAINDPIIGFLADRSTKLINRWGRRFPWIALSGIPFALSIFLVFTPPNATSGTNQLSIFLWFVFTTCLYDFFGSIFGVNFAALFPDKFRSIEERRRAAAIMYPLTFLGVAIGQIVPTLFIEYGKIQSYSIMAFIIFLTSTIVFFCSLYGVKDDRIMKERYLSSIQGKRDSFFKVVKSALKQKNFVIYIIFFATYMMLRGFLLASIPYFMDFILNEPASSLLLIFVMNLLSSLGSVFIWTKLAHKIKDNKKITLYSTIVLVICIIPIFFTNNLILFVIDAILLGIGLSGFWLMNPVILADVIDESVILSQKRNEGIYNGIIVFIYRLSLVFLGFTIAIIHDITGFIETAEIQTDLAKLGIYLHTALIPILIMVVGIIVFWKFYDLTSTKLETIKTQLNELKL
ncbi:MAG: MFS transporter [Candidatus Hodarchaeota archaeon]